MATKQAKKRSKVSAPEASLRCIICNALMMNTASGSVCSQDMDHGGVGPRLDQSKLDAAWFWQWAKELPDAEQYPNPEHKENRGAPRYLYRIAGREGYEMDPKMKPIKRKPQRGGGWTYAFAGDHIFRFDPPY